MGISFACYISMSLILRISTIHRFDDAKSIETHISIDKLFHMYHLKCWEMAKSFSKFVPSQRCIWIQEFLSWSNLQSHKPQGRQALAIYAFSSKNKKFRINLLVVDYVYRLSFKATSRNHSTLIKANFFKGSTSSILEECTLHKNLESLACTPSPFLFKIPLYTNFLLKTCNIYTYFKDRK